MYFTKFFMYSFCLNIYKVYPFTEVTLHSKTPNKKNEHSLQNPNLPNSEGEEHLLHLVMIV